MEAVCIDGTVIECDQIKHQQGGLTLHKQEPKQRVKQGGQSGSGQSGGSSQSGQSQSKQKGQSGKSSSKQGKSGGQKSRAVGFVPYEKLMYVVPDDVTHQIDELDELPA